jgi:hypothetical protein
MGRQLRGPGEMVPDLVSEVSGRVAALNRRLSTMDPSVRSTMETMLDGIRRQVARLEGANITGEQASAFLAEINQGLTAMERQLDSMGAAGGVVPDMIGPGGDLDPTVPLEAGVGGSSWVGMALGLGFVALAAFGVYQLVK